MMVGGSRNTTPVAPAPRMHGWLISGMHGDTASAWQQAVRAITSGLGTLMKFCNNSFTAQRGPD